MLSSVNQHVVTSAYLLCVLCTHFIHRKYVSRGSLGIVEQSGGSPSALRQLVTKTVDARSRATRRPQVSAARQTSSRTPLTTALASASLAPLVNTSTSRERCAGPTVDPGTLLQWVALLVSRTAGTQDPMVSWRALRALQQAQPQFLYQRSVKQRTYVFKPHVHIKVTRMQLRVWYVL